MTPGTWLWVAAALTSAALLSARAPRAWLAATLAGGLAALVAATWVLIAGATWEARFALAVGGQALHVRLDPLSALFLALVAVIGAAGSWYSLGYWPDRRYPVSAPRGRAWWSVMLLAMGFLLVAANGLHFLIAWELFAISGYFLVTADRQRPEVRAAGQLYFVASHAGTLCLFAFFAALAAMTGGWEIGPMRNQPHLAPLFWLALVGFGIKAGMFPLHVWLPSAHANAPSHVSALLSGVALKMGIYGLVRFSGWLPVPTAAAWVVVVLGVTSAVLGVAFALGQHDLKRLLAYHSVENIGIILIGLGFAMVADAYGQPAWGLLVLAGGLLHVWNHGLFKALLFLGAGSVLHATGTRVMSRLGGLWRLMPWTAALFGLGAAAIAGLPPLNGFVSEWLVFLGLFDAFGTGGPGAWPAAPAAVLLGVTGALALACFVKVCGVVFLGAPRSASATDAHECDVTMRIPMAALALACLAIGLAPAFFWRVIANAAHAWQPLWEVPAVPAALVQLGAIHVALAVLATLAAAALWRRVLNNGVRRAPTWDCGYAAPSARMQYTAGSFADIITGWFGWILRPQQHAHTPRGPFPKHASFESRTPETVLESAVAPVAALTLRLSTAVRRLQHGRLQAYLLYVLIGIVALAILSIVGSP